MTYIQFSGEMLSPVCPTNCGELGMAEPRGQLTDLLRAWTQGDESALGKIMELAYPELREIARRCLRRGRSEHTLQATALVHETYLRLIDARNLTRGSWSLVSTKADADSLHTSEWSYAKDGFGIDIQFVKASTDQIIEAKHPYIPPVVVPASGTTDVYVTIYDSAGNYGDNRVNSGDPVRAAIY